MVLSSGDWIAVIVGGAGSLRWAWDSVKVDKREDDKRTERLDHQLSQIESDLRVHQAEDRIMFQQVVDSVNKMERTLANHTRQLGFVATGANNRIIELGGHDGPKE